MCGVCACIYFVTLIIRPCVLSLGKSKNMFNLCLMPVCMLVCFRAV